MKTTDTNRTIAEYFDREWLAEGPSSDIHDDARAIATQVEDSEGEYSFKHDYSLYVFDDGSAIVLPVCAGPRPLVITKLTTKESANKQAATA
jgi:hypothetical protein